MLVLIDNYDSFTYNIYQMLAERGHQVHIVRNDAIDVSGLVALKPHRLMISPGPGDPNQAGVSMQAIAHFAGRIPVLGVCLGHQSLAQVFGARIVRADVLMHGKTSLIEHDAKTVFRNMPQPFTATRYHSLVVERHSLPADFAISGWTPSGDIMGLRHLPSGAEGVQFHPESILTEAGHTLLENFATC